MCSRKHSSCSAYGRSFDHRRYIAAVAVTAIVATTTVSATGTTAAVIAMSLKKWCSLGKAGFRHARAQPHWFVASIRRGHPRGGGKCMNVLVLYEFPSHCIQRSICSTASLVAVNSRAITLYKWRPGILRDGFVHVL